MDDAGARKRRECAEARTEARPVTTGWRGAHRRWHFSGFDHADIRADSRSEAVSGDSHRATQMADVRIVVREVVMQHDWTTGEGSGDHAAQKATCICSVSLL